MPRPEHIATLTPVTRSQLVADLRTLGVREGTTAMVHASLRSLGWVVGGSQTVVEALLTCLGPTGTLCAQASWEDVPFGHADYPEAWKAAYEAEFPPFDPELSAAAPYEGRLAERIRTWPGARRSANPAAGIAAIGAHADRLTADHRLDDGFGPGTPYARIAEDGQVVLLGAPLRTISLLHHAESIARAPKRWTTYRLPLRSGWTEIRELDVWNGVYPHAPLAAIAGAALEAGVGRRGRVGAATAHLFPAAELTRFAVAWIEAPTASPGSQRRPGRGRSPRARASRAGPSRRRASS
jgi:aminoglycoside 3-N-acetyltransferase